MRAGWDGFEHRDRISTYGEYYGSKEEACGGTFYGFLGIRFVFAQMHRLQQERRRGRRRAQSVPARCGLAPSWKMVLPAKITAAIHSQAGAAGPRAGPETIVRQAACMHTRVKIRTVPAGWPEAWGTGTPVVLHLPVFGLNLILWGVVWYVW